MLLFKKGVQNDIPVKQFIWVREHNGPRDTHGCRRPMRATSPADRGEFSRAGIDAPLRDLNLDMGIRGHRVGQSVLLAWQTDTPVNVFLALVTDAVGGALPADAAALLLSNEDDQGNDEIEGSSRDVCAFAISEPHNVAAATVGFIGIHVAWIRVDEENEAMLRGLATCNARFEPYRPELATLLLGATAIGWSKQAEAGLFRWLDDVQTAR